MARYFNGISTVGAAHLGKSFRNMKAIEAWLELRASSQGNGIRMGYVMVLNGYRTRIESGFYQRLTGLESLLGRDWDDHPPKYARHFIGDKWDMFMTNNDMISG